ncbi:amidohydrolase family protein [Amycolatopsis sp. GM8]|uniref:amidohydrolase family protein n=1 Tax=Amycolatopsis sp. GM8 TaxID=2896530 RepID=UPI001F224B95|nr:amidohydrolase family protein [Amycolatopsis sp. GM8]
MTHENTVLRDVTVVDTHDGTLRSGMDVRIDGGTIATITATGGDLDGTVIDGGGRYVVPGYLDMHAHPLGDGDASGRLALMLASGITGFRQMGGTPELLAQRRSGTLPVPADAPAPLVIPGMPLLTPVNARDEATVVATVRKQFEQGADFIKVGETTPAVFAAAQAEANRLGIPILGHLPTGADVREASRNGMRCIEHLGPGVGVLAACCADEDGIRATLDRHLAAERAAPVPQLDERMAAGLRAMVVNPLLSRSDVDVDVLRRAGETFDEAKARELAELFATHGTWHCPTLVRSRTTQYADQPGYRDNPDLRYMATETLNTWQQVADAFARRSPAAREVYRRNYEIQLRLVKVFDEAGVPMLAGSDACGAVWEVPGISLHEEFDELARAGLSPLRVLQMTTVDGAEFLGLADRIGSVEEGKAADLVLLDADPLRDVRSLRAIAGVCRAGRYHDRADLDRIRDEVARARSAA